MDWLLNAKFCCFFIFLRFNVAKIVNTCYEMNGLQMYMAIPSFEWNDKHCLCCFSLFYHVFVSVSSSVSGTSVKIAIVKISTSGMALKKQSPHCGNEFIYYKTWIYKRNLRHLFTFFIDCTFNCNVTEVHITV